VHRSEWLLVILIVAMAILAVIVWLVVSPPSERIPVDRLVATFTLTPRWDREFSPAPSPAGDGDLAIYIDSSVPIGGFLAPDGPSTHSALEAVARMAPHHLVGIDSGVRSALQWHRVSSHPSRLEKAPAIGRPYFSGGESRLDLAVAEIVQDLGTGRLEAALVLTDLVTTGEVVGAQGTAQALRTWAESDGVLAGAFDLGLLSIRARYWGIRTAGCEAPVGDWACWFSEQRQAWLPLPADTTLPLHVLAFTSGRVPARQILEGLGRELAERNFEVESELLTAASIPEDLPKVECSVRSAGDPEHQQFALFEGEGGNLRCERKDVVRVRCPLPDPLGRIRSVAESSGEALPFTAEDRWVQLEIDCSRRRDRDFGLKLQIVAEAAPAADQRWAGWSSATDDRPEDLGKTLRLQEFVEKVRVRPSRYETTVTLQSAGAAGVR
jgi:hypothetical protein